MPYFESAFAHVLSVEGTYSNHAKDRGGETNWGITERVARAHGYTGPMEHMPVSAAKAIYRGQYWDTLRLDDVSGLSEAIALELFDTGVNCGIGVAGRFLQRALNALNREGRDYQDIEVDGILGPLTVHVMRQYMAKRGDDGERVLYKLLRAQQAVRYMEIAERDRSQEAFVFGWVLNRV